VNPSELSDSSATISKFAGKSEMNGPHFRRVDAELKSMVARETFCRRKYAFDRWAGRILLVLSSPLLFLLFCLVKVTSRGPGFYRQIRVGLDGQLFEIVKFRSMVVDAEKPGQAVWCTKNDCRITGLGYILRKLHLDELPQLFNVATGEMSLVGPRPERPEICKDLAKEINGYHDRNTIKPGVTGLAQINLPPDECTDDVRRKQILDLHYIENANWWLDFRMLAATAMRMIGVKGEIVMKAMGLCRRHLLVGCSDSEHAFASGLDQGEDVSPWDDGDSEPVAIYAVAGSVEQVASQDVGAIRRPR